MNVEIGKMVSYFISALPGKEYILSSIFFYSIYDLLDKYWRLL